MFIKCVDHTGREYQVALDQIAMVRMPANTANDHGSVQLKTGVWVSFRSDQDAKNFMNDIIAADARRT